MGKPLSWAMRVKYTEMDDANLKAAGLDPYGSWTKKERAAGDAYYRSHSKKRRTKRAGAKRRGRKLKFGSPAWRKRYLKKRR